MENSRIFLPTNNSIIDLIKFLCFVSVWITCVAHLEWIFIDPHNKFLNWNRILSSYQFLHNLNDYFGIVRIDFELGRSVEGFLSGWDFVHAGLVCDC